MASIADELKKLSSLRDSGSITQEEFEQAKQAILGGQSVQPAVVSNASAEEIDRLKLQNELLRIDQEWQFERERHKVSYGKNSMPTEPTRLGSVMSVFGGIFFIGFGIFWISKAWEMRAPSFFPLFGVLPIFIGIGMPIYHAVKYNSYQTAHDDYQRRRSEVLNRINRRR